MSTLSVMIIVAALLAGALAVRPQLALSSGGRAFAITVLAVIPLAAAALGTSRHIALSKQTTFCTSCHVMELHGKSLQVDDDSLLAAVHYQHGFVPRDTACFACHTTYTMYGDFAAKLRGLRHVYVNYVKGPPKETAIKTYSPYHNRECLHCHTGTRRFEQGKTHHLEPGRMAKIRDNRLSCVGGDCHAVIHDAANLKMTDAVWQVPPDDAPVGGGK